MTTPSPLKLTRRNFIGGIAALGASSLLANVPSSVFVGGSDRLKVGLVGCGGRGRSAVLNCLEADPSIIVWAMGDVFADSVEAAYKGFEKGNKAIPRENLQIPPERRFAGIDAYQSVIASGADIVILATPPQYRPLHLEAAIDAGLHVFAEKPIAVDPAGIRKVMETGKLAKQKKLAIVAGTQRRYAANYIETLNRIRDGAIGELTGGQCYWMSGGLWHRARQPEWTEMEYQIRNWLYFTWLSGDHIVEQHVHNIDVMNWAYGGPPVKALGMGGRQSRTDPKYGNIFDHFSIEFEYPNGARVQSFSRQAPGASTRRGERVVGTKGVANPGTSISGVNPWKFTGEAPNPLVDEHRALIKSIRDGKPINDAQQVAESTLTAILGRTSAYTGRDISYDWLLNASKQDLTPADYALTAEPPAVEIAIPGVTPLV